MIDKVTEGKRAFEDLDHGFDRLTLVDSHRLKHGVIVLTHVPQ